MKNGRNKYRIFLLVLLSCTYLSANREVLDNEDLRFIAAWEKNRRITQIAESLALTAEQVSLLNEIKSETDLVKTDIEARKANLITGLSETAATIRTRLEAGESLTDEQRASLQEFRKSLRHLRRERILRLSLATMALEDLLTDQQKQTMARFLTREAGAGDPEGRGRAMERPVRRTRIMGMRVLLSDPFIDYYKPSGE